jgi:hypothetical protein
MKRMTFVIGAGASTEFGLPTGKRLLEIISNLVVRTPDASGSRYAIDSDLQSGLKEIAGKLSRTSNSNDELSLLLDEATWISSIALMAPSIDNLLHSHRNTHSIDRIGKLFICKAILEAEASSFLANLSIHNTLQHFPLRRSNRGVGEYISDKWIGKLFTLLVEMRDFEKFLENLDRIDFLCFNYDRCIEQAMTSLAIRYYKLNDLQGQEVLDRLRVSHIYGSLGALSVSAGMVQGFGDTRADLTNLSERIETFTEPKFEESIKETISASFRDCSVALFLGYGFLEINNRLLFEGGPYALDRVLGTAVGLSDASMATMSSDLEQAFLFGSDAPSLRQSKLSGHRSDKVLLSSSTCASLLDYHGVFLRRVLGE